MDTAPALREYRARAWTAFSVDLAWDASRGKKTARFPPGGWAKNGDHTNASWNGVAIDTGKSGLVVLDFDGPRGLEMAARIRAALPPFVTREVISGSGGRHWYFAADAESPMSNTAGARFFGEEASGVDVRGVGGCIFAPPTSYQTPEGRRVYQWAEDFDTDIALPLVPPGLWDLVHAPTRTTAPSAAAPSAAAADHEPPEDISKVAALLTRLGDGRVSNREHWMRAGFAVRRNELLLRRAGREREAGAMRALFEAFSRRWTGFDDDMFNKDWEGLRTTLDRAKPATLASLRMWAEEDSPSGHNEKRGSDALARTAVARSVDVDPDDVRLSRRDERTLGLQCSKGNGNVSQPDLVACMGGRCYGSVAATAPGCPLRLPESFEPRKYYRDLRAKQIYQYIRKDEALAVITPMTSEYPCVRIMDPHGPGAVVRMVAAEGELPQTLATEQVAAWNTDLEAALASACRQSLGDAAYMSITNYGNQQIIVNNYGAGDAGGNKKLLALEDRILDDAKKRRLRKLDGVVYAPLPGRPCAFVPGLTYKRHISALFRGDRQLREAPENVSRLEKFLADHVDLDEFPELEPAWHLMSFDDGVLNIATMAFTAYDAINGDANHPLAAEVARHHIALPWIGAHEAPNFMKVLDHQFEDPAVSRLLCAMLGRTLFRVRELDNWDAAPFLFGVGGTGKSLILGTLTKLFRDNAVWEFASSADGHFALEGLLGAEMALGTDMPADIERAVAQVDLQKMCSGEAVTVNCKGKKQVRVGSWQAPLAFASNHEPRWQNAGDCVGRRLVPFRFGKVVAKRDVDLVTRIKKELPAILCTLLVAYHELRLQVGPGGDVHNFLPPAVREWRGEVRAASSKLYEYLALDDEEREVTEQRPGDAPRKFRVNLTAVPGAVTTRKDFEKWFLLWQGGRDAKFTPDEATFSQHGYNAPSTRINVCTHCKRRHKTACCARYANGEKTKQYIIENMAMEVTAIPHFV